MTEGHAAMWSKIALAVLGTAIAMTGAAMLGGGVYLAALGGSLFFAPAGLALLVAGVLTVRRRLAGWVLYLAVFAVTVIWALADVGLAFWPLFSRLFAPAVLAVPMLLLMPFFRYPKGRPALRGTHLAGAAAIVLLLAGTVWGTFQTHGAYLDPSAPAPVAGRAVEPAGGGEWTQWGRNAAGTRYAAADQITPANVAGLDAAWTYRTGEVPAGPQAHVVTPLQIGGVLYGCTHTSRLFALDADTGRELWRFDPSAQGKSFPRCRGVAFFDATAAATVGGASLPPIAPNAPCARRIVSTTVDARLIAVDARNGQPCADFGNGGAVDLRQGMGDIKPGYYFQTSAPTMARGIVVVGGRVVDNQDVSEPSGVVRGFSARTGALVWAWDMGDPRITALPPPGQGYSRGTPNVWAPASYDDALGLVYLPTGNASPDFWGAQRSAASERHSSAIVALDAATGRERWTFQTVHHDLWDYDVPAQPSLYDVPDGRGGTIPALLQATKRGQIFLLDRRTGRPIAQVEERRVPGGAMPGERVSPTQPFSTGMPAIGTERLTESRMWGATLLDQLACRIAFRRTRYEGDFTPTTTQPTLQYPGWAGGMNWGSASIAENLGYAIVNDIRLPMVNRLIPRADYDAGAKAGRFKTGAAPQAGTPYGLKQDRFLSILGVPCQEPPYGTIAAIDLATRRIVWSRPIGTVEDTGPLGIGLGLPVPIGMPTLGGPITTASGLVFMAGTQDYYIRALDVRTGRELWKGRLPVGGETTPITYVSPRSGRQFVLISAGGNRATEVRGDYMIAFALPRRR